MRKQYFLTLIIPFLWSSAYTQQVRVGFDLPSTVCSPGMCTTIYPIFTEVKAATSYTVVPMNYQPSYSTLGGTAVSFSAGDKWSSVITLPFSFCFYGMKYDQLLIGENGIVTFNIAEVDNECFYNMGSTPIPNAEFKIKNAIYGVYQDLDVSVAANPVIQNVNYTMGGTAPNRYIVINYNNIPQYFCGVAQLQTSQIVLYETSNIIDVNVKKRTPCTTWNGARGVIGIQNNAGTMASFPANRNVGNWSAIEESYRFKPNGPSVTSILWTKNGQPIETTSNELTICPEENELYTIYVSYNDCNPIATVISASTLSGIENPTGINDPVDISVCLEETTGTATFDLTSNTPVVLQPVNPDDYTVAYYLTLQEALYDAWQIMPANSFVGYDGQEIYMGIQSVNGSCRMVKNFSLNINTLPDAPIAEEIQFFTAGETLADLTIQGDNILWYAEPTGGDSLNATTLLVHATTYYATQTNTSGCESARMSQSRVAVTVFDEALGNPEWEFSKLSVHPNPFRNVINLKNDNTINSVTLYNLIGQEVFSKGVDSNDVQLATDNLSAGTYLMKIHSGDQVKTIKIVKQ